jgi:acyl dehydratase
MSQSTIDRNTEQGGERYAKITDQALENLRGLIGVPITDTVEPWCYEATRDNIRHYAHGIGDDNPLWCDPDYAAGTSYGDVIAPPSFAFALSRILSGYVGGLPGVHAMWAGADLTWHQVIPRDTKIAAAHLKDLVEHQTRLDELATDVGTPAAYDYGPERCSWLTQHLTNWMGDGGFLASHQAQIRHHNVVGDNLRISGTVAAKGPDELGRPTVTIEQRAHNQHGDISAIGTGVVVLPTRT